LVRLTSVDAVVLSLAYRDNEETTCMYTLPDRLGVKVIMFLQLIGYCKSIWEHRCYFDCLCQRLLIDMYVTQADGSVLDECTW